MDSELQMQLDLSNRATVINDAMPTHSLSDSLVRSTLFQLNTQNESITGLPMLPYSFQGETFKGLNADKTVSYDGFLNRGSLNLLPYEAPYASSSSVPPSMNCGYDNGLVGDVHAKWEENRFLMHPLEQMPFSLNQDANPWLLPSTASVCSSHPFGTSVSNNELSLSLATCSESIQSQTRLASERSSHHNKELSLGFGSYGRSPQFSQILSGSSYLAVLQQILSEIASYSLENVDHSGYSSGMGNSSSSHPLVDPTMSFNGTTGFPNEEAPFDPVESSQRKQEVESKKSQLLALLQVVDDCYNRCLDEIHTVISAFHAATELDPQLHSSFALRSLSFFYKNLRERISKEILAIGRDDEKSLDKSFIQKQWALQQLKRKDQQLWRPQRGLPERSVSVLRAWMFDNFLHPYPKDAEKHLLALKSGLTRSQVSNWFINARVRLWKPLVEDMCAEMNRKKGGRQNEEGTINNGNNHRSQLSIYDCSSQRFNT